MSHSRERGYDYLEVRHSPERNRRRLDPIDSYPPDRRRDPYSIEGGNPRREYRERQYSDPVQSPRHGHKRHGSLSPIRRGTGLANGYDNDSPRRHDNGVRPRWMYDKYDREQLRPRSSSNQESYRSRRTHNLRDSDDDDDGDDNRYGKHLVVTSVDAFAKENALRHHTYVYDTVHIREGLVFRRGQAFDLGIRLNRGINLKRNQLKFVFTTGRFPDPKRGTSCQCSIGGENSFGRDNTHGWKVEVKKMISRDQFTISIYIPPNCVVSNWRLRIETIVSHYGKPKSNPYDYKGQIFILFNPWCPDDDVYFPNRDLLDEYIYNDSGAIFHGTCKQIGAKPWFFGQFEDGIIDACLYCIHKGFNFQLRQEMSDPKRVTRVISDIVNGDHQSVLLSNWSTNYSNGVPPMQWGGSPAILRQYVKTGQSVRFGQCIQFSGIVTTICRAVGIPCRSVTNFLSAHDNDGSVQIDFYWDLDNREGLAGIGDAIWNYHCWNDVWMRRGDLPPNYGGWQAIDATPLIRSSGKFQIGPCSVHAIRSSKRDLQYDTAIYFAEINADKINWVRRKIDGRWVILSTEREAIGKRLSTKRPDGRPVRGPYTNVEHIRQDITNQYKQGTGGERDSFPARSNQQDVVFGGFRIKDSMVGSDFDIDVAVRNMSRDLRTLDGKFICEAVTYTGEKLSLVKQDFFRQPLSPGRDVDVKTVITSAEYLPKLTEQLCIKVSVIIKVLETGQTHAWQDDYRLRKPDIRLEVVTDNIIASRPIECRASFKNPLPNSSLTNCRLDIEGPGIESHNNPRIRDIPPGEYWSGFINLTPRKTGRRQITATFNSNQIEDISGTAEIDVH